MPPPNAHERGHGVPEHCIALAMHWGETGRVVKSHSIWVICLLTSAMMLQGCAVGPLRLQYLWKSDEALSYYVDRASSIEYPVEEEAESYDPALFDAPRSIHSLDEVNPREVTLNECIQMALQKATVLRDAGSLGSPGNPILGRPATAPSILDPAIQQTGFLFGNRGYEAALSDFDALFTSNATWGRNSVPQNQANVGIGQGQSLVTESFTSQSRLEKPFASGATAAVDFNLNYDGNNRGPLSQAFSSSYSGLIQGELRQPLLAGYGSEFTRTAGPLNQSLRGVSGVSQGVLISRINGDISMTQFEQSVQTLVRDIELAYWDLDLFLRLYKSERAAFNDLVRFYSQLKQRREAGDSIIQAEGRILEAKARISGSLADVLDREARLRRLCSLPLNDGDFLYPADDPSEAELKPMWEASMQEALSHRVELRRQKWEIKSLDLQLKAARSLTRPRLDAVGQYRVNGLGDQLAFNGSDELDSLASNFGSLNNPGWNLGLQLSVPVGLRLARAQVRNYELRLRKARELLKAQEWEVAYELSGSMLEMERWYTLASDGMSRIDVANRYVGIVDQKVNSAERSGSDLLNLYLQAKIQQRDAQQAYMRSVIEYNKAIAELRFRKGTTLVDNQIYLAEGNWHPAAAPFAMKRALERTHAFDAHHLKTKPMNFVGGHTDSAWESLDTDDRPTIPGALQRADGDSGKATFGPPSRVPGIPETIDQVPGERNQPPLPSDFDVPFEMPPGGPMPAPPAADPQIPIPSDGAITNRSTRGFDRSLQIAQPDSSGKVTF
ncbi:MAG: TolC family protein [Fuerstiella sp.]